MSFHLSYRDLLNDAKLIIAIESFGGWIQHDLVVVVVARGGGGGSAQPVLMTSFVIATSCELCWPYSHVHHPPIKT